MLKNQKNKKTQNTILKYSIRKEAVKFYDDYSLMMSEAKSKAKKMRLKEQDLKY